MTKQEVINLLTEKSENLNAQARKEIRYGDVTDGALLMSESQAYKDCAKIILDNLTEI